MTALVKGHRETLFWVLVRRNYSPSIEWNTHSDSLTLPCFLLFFNLGKKLFILFISQQMNSAQPTRVACFAFRPSRNHNEMVTPISHKWKGKPIKRQKKKQCGRFEEFNCLFCYPLVSKFMSCLSKKTSYGNKKNWKKETLKYWHQSTRHGMANDWTKRPTSGLGQKAGFMSDLCLKNEAYTVCRVLVPSSGLCLIFV